MEIPHLVTPHRSKFVPLIRASIESSDKRPPFRVKLGDKGGFRGDRIIKIRSRTEQKFEADVALKDWTWFPARIRAAATTLRDAGLRGRFIVSHEQGEMLIR